jgi:hypothetical protein
MGVILGIAPGAKARLLTHTEALASYDGFKYIGAGRLRRDLQGRLTHVVKSIR